MIWPFYSLSPTQRRSYNFISNISAIPTLQQTDVASDANRFGFLFWCRVPTNLSTWSKTCWAPFLVRSHGGKGCFCFFFILLLYKGERRRRRREWLWHKSRLSSFFSRGKKKKKKRRTTVAERRHHRPPPSTNYLFLFFPFLSPFLSYPIWNQSGRKKERKKKNHSRVNQINFEAKYSGIIENWRWWWWRAGERAIAC